MEMSIVKTAHVTRLKSIIPQHESKLAQLTDEQMLKPVGPGLWSGKELLGHVSDSATINRQRIVRSQYEPPYDFPYYNQSRWVQIQAYNRYPWQELVALCMAEYRHLIHILENLPDKSAHDKVPVKFSSSDYVSLDWLVGHIGRHTDYHLGQCYWLAGQGEPPDERILTKPFEALA